MKSFRKIEKEHIQHSIPNGTVLSLSQMISEVEQNPNWFQGFPTPLNPFHPEHNPFILNPTNPLDGDCQDKPYPCFDPTLDSLPALDPDTAQPRTIHSLLFLRRDLSPSELIRHQMADEFIRPIFDELNQNQNLKINARVSF